VPSYTHLQRAQAVPLGHHLLAHGWALVRDAERFLAALERIEISPLGAGAGGGSRLPLDPAYAAERLGLRGVFENSLDAVAARDVVSEYLFCATQTLVDLSRLSEELVLWGSAEFGWAAYADRHTTGSSALPHKKNPDAAELARAKAGSAIGDLAGILAVQKGLPLAYNRDLQQDKEHLFRVDDDLRLALEALRGMIADAIFDPPPPDPLVAVLDLAEVLVERGVPFREAHDAVGRLVAEAAGRGVGPADLTPAELAGFHEVLRPEDAGLLDPAESVRARSSPGGGSFASVDRQLQQMSERMAELEESAGST
jgi:argininosuccinate lyase